jgi:hypothetical protein
MKTILQIVSRLDELSDDDTIYARLPWTPQSEAQVRTEPEDGSNPCEKDGLEYFLEVFIAKELVEHMGEAPLSRKCERVIQYAINDA